MEEGIQVTGTVEHSGLYGQTHERFDAAAIGRDVVKSHVALIKHLLDDTGGNTGILFLDLSASMQVLAYRFVCRQHLLQVVAQDVPMDACILLPDHKDATDVSRQHVLSHRQGTALMVRVHDVHKGYALTAE